MKTILVTGSSRGIGKAIAIKASALGYRVILHGKTESSTLKALSKSIPKSTYVVFDVTNAEATKTALSSIGDIDVLVNNAGVALGRYTGLSDVDDNIAIQEYKTNVLGPLRCTKYAAETMRKNGGGSIVNVASIKGRASLSTVSTLTYAQSKSALIAQTKAVAKELAEYGIRVNCVLPGYTSTEMSNSWTKATFDKIANNTLLRRIARPEEIANAVMFLASDEASYITGTELLVDGGYEIANK